MKAGQASTIGGAAGQDIGFVVTLLTVGAGVLKPKVGLGCTGFGTGRKRSSGKRLRDCPVSGHGAVDLNESDTGLSNVGATVPGNVGPGIMIVGVTEGRTFGFGISIFPSGGIGSSVPVDGRRIACCSAHVSCSRADCRAIRICCAACCFCTACCSISLVCASSSATDNCRPKFGCCICAVWPVVIFLFRLLIE